MTEQQNRNCRKIIHSFAVAAGVGNAIPVPGVGIAVDILVMTTMAIALTGVLGGNITQEAARGMSVAALKRTALNQPMKTISKELAKLIPLAGSIFSIVVSATIVEAAGWALANDMNKESEKGQ